MSPLAISAGPSSPMMRHWMKIFLPPLSWPALTYSILPRATRLSQKAKASAFWRTSKPLPTTPSTNWSSLRVRALKLGTSRPETVLRACSLTRQSRFDCRITSMVVTALLTLVEIPSSVDRWSGWTWWIWMFMEWFLFGLVDGDVHDREVVTLGEQVDLLFVIDGDPLGLCSHATACLVDDVDEIFDRLAFEEGNSPLRLLDHGVDILANGVEYRHAGSVLELLDGLELVVLSRLGRNITTAVAGEEDHRDGKEINEDLLDDIVGIDDVPYR